MTGNEKFCAQISVMTERELLALIIASPEYLTDPYYSDFGEAINKRFISLSNEWK